VYGVRDLAPSWPTWLRTGGLSAVTSAVQLRRLALGSQVCRMLISHRTITFCLRTF